MQEVPDGFESGVGIAGLVGRPGGALDDLAAAIYVSRESSTRGAELAFYATDILYEEARGIV